MTFNTIRTSVMIAVGSLLILSSCTTITFDQSLPATEKVYKIFPKELQGEWINDEGDELSISADHFDFAELDGEVGTNWELKIRKDQYFLNQRVDGRWMIVVGELKGDELKLYWFDGEDEKVVKKLKKFTAVKEIYGEDGEVSEYQVNPTDEEFERILTHRVFSHMGTFRRQ